MLYAILILALVVLDQVVKFLVRAHIPLGGSLPFLPHILELTYVQNTGAAFSIFSEHTWLLALVSLVASVAVAALLAVGLAFSGVLPVNKKLWSSTFVCVVGAYSLGMFALFYYLIDVRGWRRWPLFFRVVGLNSITIYLAQRIVGFGRISDFFLGGIASKCPEAVAAVISSAGYVAVCWLFLYFLYRKNVFLKV